MNLQQQFTAEIQSFLDKTGMKPTVFGRQALKDPSFVFELKHGRSPSARLIDRARAWMATHGADA